MAKVVTLVIGLAFIIASTCAIWFIGWSGVLGLWVRFGPEYPSTLALNASVLAMTAIVVGLGLLALRGLFRLLAD